jgi:hypothetical protein
MVAGSFLWCAAAFADPDGSDPPELDPLDATVDTDLQALERSHRMGKTGVVVTIAGFGAAAATAGIFYYAVSVPCRNAAAPETCFVKGVFIGGAIEFLAASTIFTGEALMFGGGISAAMNARRLGLDASPVLGTIGLSLVTAGTVGLLVVPFGEDPSDIPIAVASAGAIVTGTVFGFLQLGTDGYRQVGLIPTGNGFAVTGNF